MSCLLSAVSRVAIEGLVGWLVMGGVYDIEWNVLFVSDFSEQLYRLGGRDQCDFLISSPH